MEINEALKLLTDWNERKTSSTESAEVTNDAKSKLNDKKEIVLDKLSRIFVPSLNVFKSSLILRDKWLGKITVFLSQMDPAKEKKEKIFRVFKEAIDALQSSQQSIPLKLVPSFLELSEALNGEQTLPATIALPNNPALENLKNKDISDLTSARQEMRKASFFRAIPEGAESLKEENFLSIFRGKLSGDSLRYIFGFLQDAERQKSFSRTTDENQNFALFSLLDQGLDYITKATQNFLKPPANTNSSEIIENLSNECLEKISQLEPNERWLLCGGYGQRVQSLETAFHLLKQLPQSLIDHLPRPLPNILEGDKFPDPAEFARIILHDAISELPKLFPGIEKILGFNGINALFQDDSRSLPYILSLILPKIIGTPVEGLFREGLLKQISPFVSNNSLSNILDWIASNRNDLLNKTLRDEKRKILEQMIAEQFLTQPSEMLLKNMDAWLFTTVNSFQKTLPLDVLEGLKIDNLLSSGALWIMFERQPDDKLALVIYASGPAMGKHPLLNDTQIEWPLRINNVDPAKVNKNFLHQILSHTLEPLKSNTFCSTAENIYLGPLKQLGGTACTTPVSSVQSLNSSSILQMGTNAFDKTADSIQKQGVTGITNIAISNSKVPEAQALPLTTRLQSEIELALASFVKPDAPLPVLHFQLQLQALLDYCSPYLNGPERALKIPDANVAANLEMAIKSLMSEVDKLEPFLEKEFPQYIVGLNATFVEIKEALEAFNAAEEAKIIDVDHALQLPKKLIGNLHSVLQASKLNTDSLRDIKKLLWFLGEDVEEIIDSVTDALDKNPPIDVPLDDTNHGWIKKLISTISLQAASSAFLALWTMMKLSSGETPVALLLVGTDKVLQKILPQPLNNYYKIVISTITMQISKGLLYLTLLCLFSWEEFKEITSATHQWKHLLKVWGKALNSSQKLEFTYDPKIRNVPSEITLGLPQIELKEATVRANDVFVSLPDEKNAIPTKLINNDNGFIRVLHFAETLDIPQNGVQDYWDTVENPELILNKLTDIAVYLSNTILYYNDSQELTSRGIMAMYATLAVTDKLAKRLDNRLKNLNTPLNVYPILAFIKGHGNVLNTPELQLRVKQICDYFIPDISLDTLPNDPLSDPIISKQMKNSLFDYNHAYDLQYIYNANHLQEARYLKSLLAEKETQDKLEAAKISPQAVASLKLGVLYQESLTFTRENPIVPLSFCHLKLHTLLANRLVTSIGSEASQPLAKLVTVKADKAKDYEEEVKKQTFVSSMFKNFTSLFEKPTNHPLVTTSLPSANNNFFASSYAWGAFIDGVRTQSEILSSQKGKIPLASMNQSIKDEITKALELVFVERDDLILRSVNFLDKYLEFIPSNDKLLDGLFKGAFFGFGTLKKQLKASPQTANALAHFFKKKIEDMIDNEQCEHALWLIRLGMDVSQFVTRVNIEHDFPDFESYVDKIIEQEENKTKPFTSYSVLKGEALQVKALLQPKHFPGMSTETCNAAALAYAKAFFFRAEASQKYTLSNAVKENYRQWLPTLKAMYQGPDKEKLCNEILKVRCTQLSGLSLVSLEWHHDYILEASYTDSSGLTLDSFIISLQTGSVDGPPQWALDTHFRIRDKVNSIVPSENILSMKDDGSFITLSGLEGQYDVFNDDITLTRMINVNEFLPKDVTNPLIHFVYYPNFDLPKEFIALVNGNTAALESAKCWVEKGSSKVRKIYIEFKGHPPLLIDAEFSSKHPSTIKTIYREKQTYNIVNNNQYAHLLFPLVRFCSLEKMSCFTGSVKNRLSKIFLEPFSLSFNVVEYNKEVVAECTSHPGYHLAAQQIHPSLHGMPSYLLLKNNHNNARVLLPKEQWLTSFISSQIPKMGIKGSLARILERWIGNSEQSRLSGPQQVYTYDIDRNDLLVSEDPEAMVYLLSLYLIQNKPELAHAAFQETLRIIKLKNSHIDLSKMLFNFSLVPASHTEVSRMRRKITTAIEENNALYPKEQDSKENHARKLDEHNTHMMQTMVFLKACKEDIEANYAETVASHKLTDDEELRLYNRFIFLIDTLLKEGSGLSSSVLKIMENVGWHPSLSVGVLPPHLIDRYEALSKKLNCNYTLAEKARNKFIEFLRTPSSHTNINVLENSGSFGVILKMLGKFGALTRDIAIDVSQGISALNIKSLSKEMKDTVIPTPPLENVKDFLDNLTPQFLSYYAIAYGQGTVEQSQQLKTLLQTAKGGKDASTGKLIEFLEVTCFSTLGAVSPEDLKAILSEEDEDKKCEQLKAFFSSLNSRSRTYTHAYTALRSACSIIGYSYTNNWLASINPIGMYVSLGNTAVHTASKLYNMGRTSPTKAVKDPGPYVDPKYDELDGIDTCIDDSLKNIFDIGFEERQENLLYQIEDLDNADEINASLKKYYEKRGDTTTKFVCKGEKKLNEMQLTLGAFHSALKDRCEQDLKTLHTLINNKQLGHKYHLEDLKKALLKNEWAKLGLELQFSQEEMAELEKAVVSYLTLAVRTGQLERILENFRKLSQVSVTKNPEAFVTLLEDIATETKAKRAYTFKDTPKQAALRYLVFEFYANTLVWDVQANPVTEMLRKKEGNLFLVLLMSLGKNYFFIPTANSALADGEHIVFNTFIDPLKETSTRQVSKQGKDIFDQPANNMPISRKSLSNVKQLEAVNMMLQRSKDNRETVNIVMSEAQSLEANLLNLMYYSKRSGKNDLTLYLAKVHHKAALATLRTQGIAFQDEAHIQYDSREGELNHPIGKEHEIDTSYQIVMEECMRCLAANKGFMAKVKANDLENLSQEDYAKIAEKVAEKLSGNPIFKLKPEERKRFEDFILGKTLMIPPTFKEKATYEQICMAKGVLSITIPYLSKLNIYVDYGVVGKVAIPHSGNMDPHIGYDIKIPYEKALKTYISYLNKGLSQAEANDLRVKFFKQAKKEMRKRHCAFQQTRVYGKLEKIFVKDPEFLKTIENMIEKKEEGKNKAEINRKIVSHFQTSSEATLQFIRLFSYKHIKYWERCNTVNNHNFSSLWKRLLLDTGTPYNINACPDNLTVIQDDTTLGEATHIVSTKCIDDPLILDATTPAGILENTLVELFIEPGFSLLTDGDAVLKGLSNEYVAKSMEEHCKLYRKDIKAIVYFTKLDGKDQLVFKEIGSDTPKPFDQCKLKPSEYLAYIDENHDAGTNIATNGHQAILYKKQGISRFFQQCFRLRNIKKYSKMILSGNFEALLNNGNNEQKIRLVMTKETAKRLCPKEEKPKPPLKTVLKDANTTQEEGLLPAHYSAYRKKTHNIVRTAIVDKIKLARASFLKDDLAIADDIYNDFEDFLIPKVKVKPSELYSKNAVQMKTTLVIDKSNTALYNVIKDSNHFSEKEKADIKKAIDNAKKPPMPECVTVYVDSDNEIDFDLDNDFGAQIQTQNALANEIDFDLYEENNTAVKTISEPSLQFTESEWSEKTDYSNQEWLQAYKKPVDTMKTKLFGFLNNFNPNKKPEQPALFHFAEALTQAHPDVQPLASVVSKKLWFTNNYIPRLLKNAFGQPVDVGSKHQRNLFQILVIMDHNNVASIVALSQHEAAFFSDQAIKLRQKMMAQNMRMFVYDVPSQTIKAGGNMVDQHLLTTNEEFLDLEIMLKFLNGDDNYTEAQAKRLTKWLGDKNIEEMEKAFDQIHGQRNTASSDYSDIEHVFLNLREVPALAR